MSEDQEKAADIALYQLGQALADLRRLQATPEGERYLSKNTMRLSAAFEELRELTSNAILEPFYRELGLYD